MDLKKFNTSITINNRTIQNFSSLNIKNITSRTPVAPNGYRKLTGLQVNLTNSSASTTLNVTTGYNCSISGGNVAPFILRNGTWVKINNYTINSANCSVTYHIPADPIVGVFEANQAAPSTTIPPTSSIPQSSSTTSDYTYYYRMLPKKAHQFIGGMNLVILQLSIFDRYISI